MLDQVQLYVGNSFREHPNQIPHFEKTLAWLKYFLPNADEPFQIAAYAHDIERATRNEDIAKIPLLSVQGFCDPTFLQHHQQHGAYLITDYLKSQKYSEKLCWRVYDLVAHHEVGGDHEQNLLMDCDSLSFFETQVDGFITRVVPKLGAPKVKDKFDWMFDRISSPERKNLIRGLYKNATSKLVAL